MDKPTYSGYVHKKDAKGHWYWVYYASNGKPVAQRSESFKNQDDCINSMNIMKNSAHSPILYFKD